LQRNGVILAGARKTWRGILPCTLWRNCGWCAGSPGKNISWWGWAHHTTWVCHPILNSCAGWFCNTIAYGSVYGYTELLDQLETSYVLVGSLIAVDTSRQISWHLDNARRGGASLEQIRAVRQIAIEASQTAGVRWRNDIPEIKE